MDLERVLVIGCIKVKGKLVAMKFAQAGYRTSFLNLESTPSDDVMTGLGDGVTLHKGDFCHERLVHLMMGVDKVISMVAAPDQSRIISAIKGARIVKAIEGLLGTAAETAFTDSEIEQINRSLRAEGIRSIPVSSKCYYLPTQDSKADYPLLQLFYKVIGDSQEGPAISRHASRGPPPPASDHATRNLSYPSMYPPQTPPLPPGFYPANPPLANPYYPPPGSYPPPGYYPPQQPHQQTAYHAPATQHAPVGAQYHQPRPNPLQYVVSFTALAQLALDIAQFLVGIGQ